MAKNTTKNKKDTGTKKTTQATKKEVEKQPVKESQETINENKINEKVNENKTNEETEVNIVDANSPTYVREAMKKINNPDDAYKLLKDNSSLRDFVIGLKQYYDFIRGPKKDNPEDYIAANYRLYNLLLKHLGEENFNRVKQKLNLLLKILYKEKDGIMNIVNLLKYDHYWKYGQKTRVSYYLLITFLEGLADPKTRKQELKRLNVDKLAEYLPANVMQNLRRFVNM